MHCRLQNNLITINININVFKEKRHFVHLRCVIYDRTFKAEAGKFVETSKSKLKTHSHKACQMLKLWDWMLGWLLSFNLRFRQGK